MSEIAFEITKELEVHELEDTTQGIPNLAGAVEQSNSRYVPVSHSDRTLRIEKSSLETDIHNCNLSDCKEDETASLEMVKERDNEDFKQTERYKFLEARLHKIFRQIDCKKDTVKEAEIALKSYSKIQTFYRGKLQKMDKRMEEREAERQKLLRKLEKYKAAGNDLNKIDKIEKRLRDKQQQIAVLKKFHREISNLTQVSSQNENELNGHRNELEEMKVKQLEIEEIMSSESKKHANDAQRSKKKALDLDHDPHQSRKLEEEALSKDDSSKDQRKEADIDDAQSFLNKKITSSSNEEGFVKKAHEDDSLQALPKDTSSSSSQVALGKTANSEQQQVTALELASNSPTQSSLKKSSKRRTKDISELYDVKQGKTTEANKRKNSAFFSNCGGYLSFANVTNDPNIDNDWGHFVFFDKDKDIPKWNDTRNPFCTFKDTSKMLQLETKREDSLQHKTTENKGTNATMPRSLRVDLLDCINAPADKPPIWKSYSYTIAPRGKSNDSLSNLEHYHQQNHTSMLQQKDRQASTAHNRRRHGHQKPSKNSHNPAGSSRRRHQSSSVRSDPQPHHRQRRRRHKKSVETKQSDQFSKIFEKVDLASIRIPRSQPTNTKLDTTNTMLRVGTSRVALDRKAVSFALSKKGGKKEIMTSLMHF